MTRGLVGESGRVDTTDHDADPPSAKLASEGIRVKSGRCRGRNRHEVRRQVEAHRLDDFVRVRDRVLWWRERRDQRHGELRKLNQTATTETSGLRRLRGDQVNTHTSGATRTVGAPNRAPPSA